VSGFLTLNVKKTRRRSELAGDHSPDFEANVVLTAINGEKTLAEPAHPVRRPPDQITNWKARTVERTAGLFGVGAAGVLIRAEPTQLPELRPVNRVASSPLAHPPSRIPQ
jgi:hypothetical protein